MKNKLNRVIKCLTCLVTCFMVVLTAMVSPAYAAPVVYNPGDYISEISVSGDVKTVTYDFNDISGYFRWWTGAELVEFYGWGFSGQVEAHTNWPALTWFPFGAYASTSGFDAALDISDILPYSDIDFSASMEVIVHLEDFHETDYVNGNYKVEYYYYDANMQYIGNYVSPVMTHKFDLVSTDDKYGAVWLGTIEYSGTFPADAVYVVPYFNINFGIPSIYLPDSIMDITFQRAGFLLSVDIDTILDNSHQMQAIKDKLDDLNVSIGDVGNKIDGTNDRLDSIISGTPEQNESADAFKDVITDQAGQIQDSLDVMDSVPKPDASDIKTSVDSFVPETDMLAYTTPLTMFWTNSTLAAMVVLVVSLATVSFVFFGKKG